MLFTSTGPGVSNAATGIVEAGFASTPVLHITGQTKVLYADRGMGLVHDIPDQLGLMRAAGKAAYRIRAPGEAFAVLRQAVSEAVGFPRGPVTVEVPIDVQSIPVQRPPSLDYYAIPAPIARAPTESEMGALVDLVADAKRPMLWLGRGALGASEQVRRLLDMGHTAGIIPQAAKVEFAA